MLASSPVILSLLCELTFVVNSDSRQLEGKIILDAAALSASVLVLGAERCSWW